MNKILLAVICIILSNKLSAQFSGPESVEYDAANSRYFVSNVSAGNIVSVVPGQSPVVFTTAVTSPHGLVIVDSVLYVADGSRVKGFNIYTGALSFNLYVGGDFLNGICADNAGNLYVTDFADKEIIRVDIHENTYTEFVRNTTYTPNGILFDDDNNRLIFVTWGSNAKVISVDLSDSSTSVLYTLPYSNLDGIVQDQHGRFYISSWGIQSVVRIDSAFSLPPVVAYTGLANPADIYYNVHTDTLAIPNSGNSTVTYHHSSSIVSIGETFTGNSDFMLGVSGKNIFLSSDTPLKKFVHMEIIDVRGSVIAGRNFSAEEFNGKVVHDLSIAPAGIYFLRLTSGDRVYVRKFLLQ